MILTLSAESTFECTALVVWTVYKYNLPVLRPRLINVCYFSTSETHSHGLSIPSYDWELRIVSDCL